MARTTVTVRLNRARIRAMTLPGGDIYDTVEDQIAPAILRDVKQRTPIGSGNMHRAMRILDVSGGPREVVAKIGVDDPIVNRYIHRVIRGTGGASARWQSTSGRPMPVGAALVRRGVPFGNVSRRPPKKGRLPHRMFAATVRGQEPNNFMQRGMRAALTRLGFTLS